MSRGMAVVLFGVLLAVVACGGSDNRLSKEEFLKQGNTICEALRDVGLGSTDGKEPDAAAVKKFIKETLGPSANKRLDELDALRPPNDLQGPVDTMIAHARAVLATLDKQADTDPGAILADTNPFGDVNQEAANIGLTACAGPG